jgi:hypothetical protein
LQRLLQRLLQPTCQMLLLQQQRMLQRLHLQKRRLLRLQQLA